MSTRLMTRALLTGTVALLMTAVATPVLAQASIKGRVLNQQKRSIPEADVVATCLTVKNVKPAGAITDSDGRFNVSGLAFGKWDVVVSKGNLIFRSKEPLNLIPGVVTDMGDIILEPMPAGTAPAPTNKKEADERNKKNAEIQAKFKGANEDLEAGKFDEAIVKLEAVMKDVAKCSPCAAKIGEVYLKKDDLANSEKFLLQAIEFDETNVDPYNMLATIYNSQQKYDESLKMAAKVTELNAAKGVAQDPTALYNQGVVLWNAGKIAEAEPVFKKVTELDPKNAPAFFRLGMAEVNAGKLPEAIKSFETYLVLAPKGPEADQAKAMLLAIKK